MNTINKCKKGQYFSFDAIIASIIFIFTFIALVNYWTGVKSTLESKDEEIFKEAARISDGLFTPAYLQNSYIDKKVNETKLNDLPDDNDTLKEKLNSYYNIFLNVSIQPGNTNPTFVLSKGGTLPPNAKNIAKVRRIFVLQNGSSETPAVLDLYLYN